MNEPEVSYRYSRGRANYVVHKLVEFIEKRTHRPINEWKGGQFQIIQFFEGDYGVAYLPPRSHPSEITPIVLWTFNKSPLKMGLTWNEHHGCYFITVGPGGWTRDEPPEGF